MDPLRFCYPDADYVVSFFIPQMPNYSTYCLTLACPIFTFFVFVFMPSFVIRSHDLTMTPHVVFFWFAVPGSRLSFLSSRSNSSTHRYIHNITRYRCCVALLRGEPHAVFHLHIRAHLVIPYPPSYGLFPTAGSTSVFGFFFNDGDTCDSDDDERFV